MLYGRFLCNFPFYFMQKLNICKHVINVFACIYISIGTCTERTITVRDFCLNYILWNKTHLTA